MIVGIDLSSFSIALGILSDTEVVSVELWANKREDFEARFDQLTDKLQTLFSELAPDIEYVYIELIPYVQSPRTALTLASVLGMVRAICRLKGIPYETVHNLTWKKGIGLKGKVKKEDTEALMRIRYNINADTKLTDNQCDSLGVATYGAAQRGKDTSNLSFDGAISLEQEPTQSTAKAPVRRKQKVDKSSGSSTKEN